MARFPRTLADALAGQAEAGRSTRTEAMSVDALAPIGPELIIENAIQAIHIAVGAVTTEAFDEVLTGTVNDLVHGVGRIDQEIIPAISEAANSAITDDRIIAGSLTTWPFAPNTIPSGTVGTDELADFSLVVRKFKDDRHRIY